jgi:hypothetical protein
MSAIGPKQTWASALHMSALGGKADVRFASQIFANDQQTLSAQAASSITWFVVLSIMMGVSKY